MNFSLILLVYFNWFWVEKKYFVLWLWFAVKKSYWGITSFLGQLFINLLTSHAWFHKANTVALKGQMYRNLRKHQKIERHCKSTQSTLEIIKKKHIKKQKCFWGDNNMTGQLRKWQANSKELIANMYLEYFLNRAIKTPITCIFLSLTTLMDNLHPLSVSQYNPSHVLVSVISAASPSYYCVPRNTCVVYWRFFFQLLLCFIEL